MPTMESATWCRTLPALASAASRLRPEVWKKSSTALSSNEGELARSTTTCAPVIASFSPSPVMVLTPLLGEAARTSWPAWRRMATHFEPIRPVPPMTTIFMIYPPCRTTRDLHEHDLGHRPAGCARQRRCGRPAQAGAQKQYARKVDAARALLLDSNVRGLAAIAR